SEHSISDDDEGVPKPQAQNNVVDAEGDLELTPPYVRPHWQPNPIQRLTYQSDHVNARKNMGGRGRRA
ncbi:hypothetical protein A2U01_0117649, partial [Trifolium medium]|nr:hypothetical protein [Trifolium medium]